MMGNREQGACVGGLIMIIYAYFSRFISDHFDSEAICKKMLNGHGTNIDLINCKYTILEVKLQADLYSSLAGTLILILSYFMYWKELKTDSNNRTRTPSYGTISSQQNNDQSV
ncbi:hypothetical protein F8M41_013877 [Gigaspora margarita]|uniref:Uncharacterized protein n=1 Tax=Gigaspora margarita TaxID=4874 RepID=A0A8H4ARZ0_GIGMA|nr:hypothetical protein F8M41_013877 [Gigaspora margarita]